MLPRGVKVYNYMFAYNNKEPGDNGHGSDYEILSQPYGIMLRPWKLSLKKTSTSLLLSGYRHTAQIIGNIGVRGANPCFDLNVFKCYFNNN